MSEDPQSSTRNQTLAHEWVGLIARWEACAQNDRASDPAAKRIEALIAGRDVTISTGGIGWEDLNQAEQLLAQFLSLSQLTVEFANLLELAKTRALPALAAHQANSVLFPATSSNEAQARDAYVALLHDLQSDHVQQRFRRSLSGDASQTLFRFGAVLTVVATLLLSLLASRSGHLVFGTEGFLFLLVATAGCVGAFFSRTMTFLGDSRTGTTSYDTFISAYVGRSMRLRIGYGMIGAVVFYLILKSGIVAGTIFPELAKLPKPTMTVLIDIDIAKVLVWSFIAGFSERLVPDTLTRVEGKAAQTK